MKKRIVNWMKWQAIELILEYDLDIAMEVALWRALSDYDTRHNKGDSNGT